MKSRTIALTGALLSLLVIVGCGKANSGKGYVGTYVCEDNPKNILRINKDKTYELEEEFPYVPRRTSTGNWKIDEDGIVLYEGESRTPKIIGKLKGDTLIDQLPGGHIWVRQGSNKTNQKKKTSSGKKISADGVAGEYTLKFANRGRAEKESIILKKDGTIAKVELRGSWKIKDNEIEFYKGSEKEKWGRMLEDRVKIYGIDTFLKAEGAEPIRSLEIAVYSEPEAVRPSVSGSGEGQQTGGRRQRTPRRIPSGPSEPATESAPKLEKVTLWSKYKTTEDRLYSLALNKDETFEITDDSEDMKWRVRRGALEFYGGDEVMVARFEGDSIVVESTDKKQKFTLTKLDESGAAGEGTMGKKYFGKYTSENRCKTLEIEPDGTYTLEIRSEYGTLPTQNLWGEWKIDEDGIVLYVERTRLPRIIGQIEGNTLIDRLGGEVFTKDESDQQGQSRAEPDEENNIQSQSRATSKQELVEAIEGLQKVVTKKIVMDVDTTAQCFTSVKEYRRDKYLADLMRPVLRVIQGTLSVTTKLTSVSSISSNASYSFSNSEYVCEALSIAMMCNGLWESGEKLHYAIDGTCYVDTIEKMLDAADETTVIRSGPGIGFDSEHYKMMIKTCLEGDVGDYKTPLIIPRTSGFAPNNQSVSGALALQRVVWEECRDLVSQIQDTNLPPDFPIENTMREIEQLQRQIAKSCMGTTEVNYKIYGSRDIEGCQLRPLGAIAEMNRMFGTTSSAIGQRMEIEIYAEFASLESSAGDAICLLSYKIPSSGLGEAGKVIQQVSLVPKIVIKGEKTFKVDPEEEFYQLPQEMVFSLPVELSNLWRITDDTVYSLISMLESRQLAVVTRN